MKKSIFHTLSNVFPLRKLSKQCLTQKQRRHQDLMDSLCSFSKKTRIWSRTLVLFFIMIFQGKANLERLNWVNLALIAKPYSPECINNYQPISRNNSSCKIISKLLANRLSQVINSLINDSQSAFIKGICIADNIIADPDMIFNLQKRKLMGQVFKIDFAKAFDSLDWNFLLDILATKGFGPRYYPGFIIFLVLPRLDF